MGTRDTELIGTKKMKRTILEVARKLEKLLDLEYHDVRICFNRGGTDAACEADTKWEYNQTTLTWNLEAIVGTRRPQLIELIVHEYVHILMGPIQEFIPAKHVKREEFVTDNIARCLVRQLKGKL